MSCNRRGWVEEFVVNQVTPFETQDIAEQQTGYVTFYKSFDEKKKPFLKAFYAFVTRRVIVI